MKHIESYLNSLLNKNNARISVDEIKEVLKKSFLTSHIGIASDDACSPLVKEGGFLKIFSDRMFEGAIGDMAMKQHEEIEKNYKSTKKNDKRLVYAFSTDFKDVGSVKNTYATYKNLIIALKEIAEDGSFLINSHKLNVTKSFDAQSSLIVTNMDEISNEIYKKRKVDENSLAISTLATIFVLKAIANSKEVEEIDALCEQLNHYIAIDIANAGKKYIGDKQLVQEALYFAKSRLQKLNNAAKEVYGIEKAYNVDLDTLIADEKFFVEMNKVSNEISGYRINFYANGVNAPVSYIDKNGEFQICKIKTSDYARFEAIDEILVNNSLIDTDEEIFETMCANFLIASKTNAYDAETQKNLVMAFALPMIQSMNKIGDKKANVIFKKMIDKLANNEDIIKLTDEIGVKFKKVDVENVVKETTQEETKPVEIKPEEETKEGVKPVVEEPVQEVIKEVAEEIQQVKTKKLKTDKQVKKVLFKAFNDRNIKYYDKIEAGKIKRITTTALNLAEVESLAGKLSIKEKQIKDFAQDYIEVLRTKTDKVSKIVAEFAEQYIYKRTAEIVAIDDADVQVEELKKAKKEVQEFHDYKVRGKKKKTNAEQLAIDIEENSEAVNNDEKTK